MGCPPASTPRSGCMRRDRASRACLRTSPFPPVRSCIRQARPAPRRRSPGFAPMPRRWRSARSRRPCTRTPPRARPVPTLLTVGPHPPRFCSPCAVCHLARVRDASTAQMREQVARRAGQPSRGRGRIDSLGPTRSRRQGDDMQITRNSIDTTPRAERLVHRRGLHRRGRGPRRQARALSANSVHFTPGARTAWHTHPNGQTIFVTEGIGLASAAAGRSRSSAPATASSSSRARSTGTAPRPTAS